MELTTDRSEIGIGGGNSNLGKIKSGEREGRREAKGGKAKKKKRKRR